MASRAAKDVPVSEKRGKSPSNLRHTDPAQRRKSPHPPSLDHHQKPVSASDHKNAPNYLRPTVSSRTDTSKNNSATKKPSTTTCTTDTAHKSTINRRRSLDNKPPPPNAHLPKTHSTSPTPVEKNPRPTLSTKAKPTSTITKPLPEKAAKTFSKDVGKPHSLYSRPVKNVKKNTTSTATAGAGAGAINSTTKKLNSTGTNALATKAPISTSDHSANIEDTPKHEPLQEAIEPSVTESEEEELASNERSNNGLPTEVLILEDKEHVDIPPAEVHQPEEIEESEEQVKKLSNSSTVLEKQHTTPVPEEKNTNHVVEMEETEPEEIHIDGPEIEDKEVEEESKDENDHNNHQEEESFESEPIAVVNNKKKNEGGEHSGIQEKPEEKGLEEKEEVKDEGKKGSEAEYDTEKVEEVSKEVKPEAKEVKAEVKELRPEVKEVKPEEANKINLVSRPQGSKKDNTAYNDVIEETASKLREQRRNKVKALVGAFETVISLEDPEAETPRGN